MAIVTFELSHVCRMVNICTKWVQRNTVTESQISDIMKSVHLSFFAGAWISSVKFTLSIVLENQCPLKG